MTEQTTEKAPTVDELVATFGDLDDAALQSLHDDEKATDGGGRTTLLDAIHREQSTRADTAKADQDSADAKAREQGYADAATQRTAENAAAKQGAKAKAAASKTAARKPAAKKQSAGFDVAGDGADQLRALATKGGTATLTLGDDNGPDANLTGVEATLGFTRGKPVNRDRVSLSSAGMPGLARFTHAYALDGKTVIGKRELASPLPLAPGEQVAFNAGTLAF